MPAMVAPHSDPFDLLVGGITSNKKIALVNKIVKVKQIIPIEVRQVKQFAARDDGMNSVMIGDVSVQSTCKRHTKLKSQNL